MASLGSMLLGSFAAIRQPNIKRLMAYSSIGNMGYALIGLATGTPEGVQGIIIYMAIYLAMTLGTFALILVTVVGQGLTLPWLIRRLGVVEDGAEPLSDGGRWLLRHHQGTPVDR